MLDKMQDFIRFSLYGILIFIGFLLFQAWEKDHPPVQAPAVTQSAAAVPAGHYVPQVAAPAATTAVAAPAQPAATPAPIARGKLVHVQTDVLDLTIDTLGGDIINAKLLKFPESLGSKTPFVLFNDDPQTRYVAESGLLSKAGPDTTAGQAQYQIDQTNYVLTPTQNSLAVKLNWQKNGVNVTKTLTFTRGSYEVNVNYTIANQSSNAWQGNLYAQLMRTNTPPVSHNGLINLATYFGAAISTPDKPFEKISFKKMTEQNLNQASVNGWAAMIQHYFISAWVPPKDATSTYYSRVTADGLYTIGLIGQPLSVAPGVTSSTNTKLYVGPATATQLEKTAPTLNLTIDYGWFWFISQIIFWMMQQIYNVIGNWGWAIVIVTIVIKMIFYPLSSKSFKSMSAMKKLQPKLAALKERYGDDKQKYTQAMMDLYKQEKINPMAGCLPILVQIPVFIALYWVLVESVELRQAPWIFWIHDLSRQDPYYVLPVLMGISMFIQQKLNPPPPDPLQAKMMMLMPLVFTVLFANFPAGLMLYWFVNNTLSFMQQWYVMRE